MNARFGTVVIGKLMCMNFRKAANTFHTLKIRSNGIIDVAKKTKCGLAALQLCGGGTGFIGRRLQTAFSSVAEKVLVVSRHRAKDGLTWDDISRNGIPSGTDVVVNVAGENVLNPLRVWLRSFKRTVITSRVETTKCLAQAISKSGKSAPKVFITISGVNYYKPNGEEHSEYEDVSTFDFFSNLCKQWENAGEIDNALRTRKVVIRSGVVLGNDGGMIAQIKLPFWLGFGGIIGSGKQWMPWIHADDLTNLFVFAAQNEKITGVLNGVAPVPSTNYEFTKAYGKAIRRPTLVPFPEFAVKLVFGNERSDMLLKGAKVLPRRVLDYGFKYKYADIHSACNQLAKSTI